MTTPQISNVTVHTQANVYFDGRCISHTLTLADGARKSVGVILPSTLSFNTGAPEVMEAVAGACEVLLPGQSHWQRIEAGQSFAVPGQSSFQIRVEGTPFHYICHFG
ncbi:pyrimidine/purine nucleoside phosphorylase [Caldimonas sp.]|uniref:pyrimidine/purine nucleoside phosphorylase n=1 Tax=Caldimonas sp. TaxID=2838790 RepID=UPI0029DC7A2C|nr:pyrimidine/purine nucleoside phosphorylase [Caldimonas manganoxidans]